VRNAYDRLTDLCEDHGWDLQLATGQERPELSEQGLPVYDLVLEVRIPGSPPTFAVHAPVEDPIYYAAAVALDKIRAR
jgi:hypothetical protein